MSKLKYLIGAEGELSCEDDETIVVPYGYKFRPSDRGAWIQYCNCRDEESAGTYGPYLPSDDIDEKYNEPAPDPAHDGFWRNLRDQLDRAKSQGFTSVELDNLDSYTASVALLCFNEVQSRGLKVFVKNPVLVDGDNAALMRHPAVCGAIVEPDCGTPAQMQAIRNGLPVYFVSGDYEDAGLSFPNLPFQQETTMSDPAWLAQARASIGKYFDADAPRLAREVAAKYPDMESYAAQATTKTPWCGIFFAAMMTRAGIRPPYDRDNVDTDDFMWADAPIEAKWGTIVSRAEARPGDVIVLRTPHHITFFDGDDGGNRFFGIGGNQGDAVNRASFSWDGVRAVVRPPSGQQAPVSKRQTRITATVWDDAMGAYGPIDHSKPSVSLPAPFPRNALPLVRVYGPRGTAEGPVTDKGPWYDGTSARPADRYWETGQRPRAESDSRTNGAGIDLNPVMADAVGIDGKGLVDWEFVGAEQEPVEDEPMPEPTTLKELLAQLETERKAVIARLDAAAALIKKAQEIANQPPPKPEAGPGIDILGMIPESLVPVLLPIFQKMTAEQVIALLRGLKGQKSGMGAGTAALAGAGGGMGFAVLALEIITKLMGGG